MSADFWLGIAIGAIAGWILGAAWRAWQRRREDRKIEPGGNPDDDGTILADSSITRTRKPPQ
jgi:hypothetical protein